MTPAEKVAKLFASRNKLKPPVDVRSVLARFADIEEDDIPLDVDAVFLGKSQHRNRPLVVLQRERALTRRTFTLGHELGHAIIPWHAGTFFCHTDFNAKLDEFTTREVEAEANRFSSELLTPTEWVKKIAAKKSSLSEKVEELRTSGLSALACSFSLVRQLPPGHMFTAVNSAKKVTYAASSPNSPLNPPGPGSAIMEEFKTVCEPPEIIRTASAQIYWWKLPEESTETAATLAPSREILDQIFEDLGWGTSEIESARMSINGIIGVGNSKYTQNPNLNFVALLKGRFLSRSHLTEVTQHRKFQSFLEARASELRAKHSLRK
jgi:hypothetical protein